MRNQAVVVSCALLFGCASPHWVKLDSAGKIEPTQNSGDLLKALDDCSVVAAATPEALDLALKALMRRFKSACTIRAI
jgi:hypothetical protein